MDDNPLEENSSKPILEEFSPESTPAGAENFSMKAQKDKFVGGGGKEQTQKGIAIKRLPKDADVNLQNRVNSFLNETSKGSEINDRKFQLRLSRETYHCYAVQEGDSIQGAIDAEITENGIVNISRIRTNPEASKKFLEENGKSLGQAMFENAIADFKEKGANGIYAEVTQDGHTFLKRMAEQGLITLDKDEPIQGTNDRLVEGRLTSKT